MGIPRGIAAIVASMSLLLIGGVTPANATSNRGWAVAPGSFGIMYGSTDPDTISAVRAWEAATWCTIQPSPDADMQSILSATLGPQLDEQRALGASSAIVGLGHPPAWVFGDHPLAQRPVVQYGCSASFAATISIPKYSSLKRDKRGNLPLQAQRWNAYVSAVIDFINARYGRSMSILLQVWNEPNLTSGLSVKTKVPGSSRTTKDAVNSLYELERITAAAIRARGNPAITLTSTSMFQRTNAFFKRYLAKHGKRPVISSLAFNVYSAAKRSPDAMVKDWNSRVTKVRAKVNKYKRLRRLPAYLTETNVNLINNDWNKANLSPQVTDPAQQRRLATAIQMDAFYNGFRSVYWLSGPQKQAAVHIGHTPGTPARSALKVLRSHLINKVISGCRTKSGVRSCSFRDPGGPTITVMWRMSKSSKVRLPRTSTLVQMTGETSTVGARSRITVGTTPIVVYPA